MNRPSRRRGFTIIELMVVVTVLAILASLAGPSFGRMITAQRLRNASFDLVGDLLLARNEALKLQRDVIVAPTGDDWPGGWQVTYTDEDGNDVTLTSRPGLPTSVQIVAPAALTFVGANGGRLNQNAQIVVKSSDLDNDKWRCILIDATGRARSRHYGAGC